MFEAKFVVDIEVENIPVQWIPKIEIYYPDLPQFPIMYIHKNTDEGRLIAIPVAVSYEITGRTCTAKFCVLSSLNTESIRNIIKAEIEERIGLSDKITKEVVLQCCKDSAEYKSFFSDLWQYISKSYGDSIPYGRFYEEVYSIVRFVSAWQPKTGRQSEMRMLYNFMSIFGDEVKLPSEWNHLECYVIPHLDDVKNKNFDEFEKFKTLDSAMRKTFEHEFTKTVEIKHEEEIREFLVQKYAWKQNKDSFINLVSRPLYESKILNEDERICIERLVDAFNRHSWRAAYFISAYVAIDKNYDSWTKDFFKNLYINGGRLKGYSEKVIACFLQQGFKKEEIIPIDIWIESFYQNPLGLSSNDEFYKKFDLLGKLERIIWLASQANKTNMKAFFNLLWCQRYGTTGNGSLRGINPIACSECALKGTCVGLSHEKAKKVLLLNDTSKYSLQDNSELNINDNSINLNDVFHVCVLENKVPKKVFSKSKQGKYYLIDEFSGYIMNKPLPHRMVEQGIVTMGEFTDFYKDFVVDKDATSRGDNY